MNHTYEVYSAVSAVEEYWHEMSCKSPRLLQSRIPTRLWQNDVVRENRYERDVLLFSRSKLLGTIDLLDKHEDIGFQLRILGQQPHNEFYKDVLRVAVFNQHTKKKIRKLVFITRTRGADKLNTDLGKAVCDSRLFGFEIEVIGIGGDQFE